MRSRLADHQKNTAQEVEQRDAEWYHTQLATHCSIVVPKGKDYLIVCPFHADSNPSCGVDRHTGIFKCFSCGAGGGWNKLARQIGAEVLRARGHDKPNVRDADAVQASITRAFAKAGVVDPRKQIMHDRPLVKPWPVNEPWRSVAGDFLHQLGAVDIMDFTNSVRRIGLPVRDIDGDLQGYTCRVLDPADAKPKYLPMAPDASIWRKKALPARVALFLIDRVVDLDCRVVVLVEGPYDALHLASAGIPAVAILGTNNWTPEKRGIIAGLGLDAVVVCMDNDESGSDAAKEIVSDLQGEVRTVAIGLPKTVKDPGDLGPKQLAWLTQKIASIQNKRA